MRKSTIKKGFLGAVTLSILVLAPSFAVGAPKKDCGSLQIQCRTKDSKGSIDLVIAQAANACNTPIKSGQLANAISNWNVVNFSGNFGGRCKDGCDFSSQSQAKSTSYPIRGIPGSGRVSFTKDLFAFSKKDGKHLKTTKVMASLLGIPAVAPTGTLKNKSIRVNVVVDNSNFTYPCEFFLNK